MARMGYAKFRLPKVPNVTNLQQHIFNYHWKHYLVVVIRMTAIWLLSKSTDYEFKKNVL